MRAEQKLSATYKATKSVIEPSKVLARQIGPVIEGYMQCCPDTRNVPNIIWGLRERVLLQPPHRAWKHGKPFRQFVANWLHQNIKVVGNPPTFDEWIEHARYTHARKDQLRQAYAMGEKPKRWLICKSFIKREFYPSFKPPRTINSRVDNYKAFAGPWFHWVEKSMIKQCKSFVKGLNPTDRIVRISETVIGKFFYGSDFSRFESQMTKDTMEICEMQLYRHFGLPERYLAPLTGENELRFGGVTAKVEATRMSGDMCTSIGNGFTNLMVNLYAAHVLGAVCTGVVEGDDGLFATDILPSEELISELGFKMSVDRVSNLGDAGFCSSWWTNSGERCLNVRRVLSRIGWSFVCPPNANDEFRQKLLNAKLESMCDLSDSTPVLWKLQKYHKGRGLAHDDGYHNASSSGKYWNETSGLCNLKEPSMELRLFVARTQQLSIADQLMIEGMIDANNWNFGDLLLEKETTQMASDNLHACSLVGQEICQINRE